ncbi:MULTISPECIES: acyl carrier protein [Pseudomonas]|jgi:acyl carrier protein|uniref:Acyl carrier protein n=1 Tax=Pseudomonas gingeri TaxID=117681 RepID=A0A7Y7WCB3_9PSED|nr:MULTISPECIES: acyl carrier protein [Pseudomonas]MCU1737897.1 acyl carrier protein [Pseudomonas sp. 20S_6.2_Bac1]NWB46744.1 acyl carrier protein [Pseudomonas gingeri]WMS58812.1 hypothetical protein GNFEDENH_00075 [Pseudomonas sp. QS1027]
MLEQQALDQVFNEVEREIAQILAAKGGPFIVVEAQSRFSDLGMSSLELATLVSTLESLYDVDPFASDVAITSIVTVRDLCQAYAGTLHHTLRGQDPLDAELLELRRL